MTDDDVHAQAPLYAVGSLDADEVRQFEAHLSSCADCRNEVAAMNEVTASLSGAVATDPPPSLRSAILAQIAGAAQEPASPRPAAAAVGAARGRHAAAHVVETAPAATVTPIRSRWRERAPLLVAAAAVVAAVGVGGWALNDRNDARDQTTTAQQTINDLTSILNAGDAQTASTTTKNGATMTVVRSQSRGDALLLASELPKLATDQTYQAWTIDADGTTTSAGVFESQGAQTAYPLPAAAVDTGTVAVTIEDAPGAKTPSKPIVALTLG
jgi:anti-sigma-K factor RskA